MCSLKRPTNDRSDLAQLYIILLFRKYCTRCTCEVQIGASKRPPLLSQFLSKLSIMLLAAGLSKALLLFISLFFYIHIHIYIASILQVHYNEDFLTTILRTWPYYCPQSYILLWFSRFFLLFNSRKGLLNNLEEMAVD